jgi:uncharacterized Zn finger protein (UPF0148 family)
MTIASVVTCPICGGPTHLSRDTGDFTCDRCGKIVVRATKNNWVPELFDQKTSIQIESSIIKEAIDKEIKDLIKEMITQGWDVTQTASGHNKGVWPYAPVGEQIEFFGSTPSDPRAIKNIKSRIKRKMKQYPAPTDDRPDDQTTTASKYLFATHWIEEL